MADFDVKLDRRYRTPGSLQAGVIDAKIMLDGERVATVRIKMWEPFNDDDVDRLEVSVQRHSDVKIDIDPDLEVI
jgi:hypothetical protein